jgi:hypothetical protein
VFFYCVVLTSLSIFSWLGYVMGSSLALSFSVCLSMYLCVERVSCRGLEIRLVLFIYFRSTVCSR